METLVLDARSRSRDFFLKSQNKRFNFCNLHKFKKIAAYETHSSMAAYAIYLIPNSFSESLPGPAHRCGAGLFKIRPDADFRSFRNCKRFQSRNLNKCGRPVFYYG